MEIVDWDWVLCLTRFIYTFTGDVLRKLDDSHRMLKRELSGIHSAGYQTADEGLVETCKRKLIVAGDSIRKGSEDKYRKEKK
jgi:hypothetical protein